jgi:Domain of unknown function (DUF6946)
MRAAVMLVHAFGDANDESFGDFATFARLLGASPERNRVCKATRPGLFLGWVDGEKAYLDA